MTDRRAIRSAVLCGALLLTAAVAFGLDAELRRRALSAEANDRWAACEPLARDGSAEALKLLLGVLRSDADPENRDHAAWACWYLASDEAPDALAAIAGGGASPSTRSLVAYGLGRTRKPRALDALVRMSKSDTSAQVRCEAIEAMRWFAKSPIPLECCKSASRSSDPQLRACAVATAGRLSNGAGRDVVLAAWSETDDGIRCAALDAMSIDDALPRLPEAAAAKGWRLRAQAAETALRWRRPECVEVLIGLVGDEVPRVACAAVRALRYLSGKEIAAEAELWQAWWQASRDSWKAPPPPGNPNDAAEAPVDPKATRARFQGVEIESDRLVFVIDHSTSMEKTMPTGVRRIDAVRAELTRTLAALPDGVRANLVTFGEGVRSCFPSARPLTPKVRQAIAAFSEATPLEADTNLAGGVLKAFEDETIDSVYLLTDGAPSTGDFVSFTRVRIGIQRANRTRRIAVHTIGFGVTGDNTRDFLRELATENGGRSAFR